VGRRFAVHAGPHRQALIAAALVLACGGATAAPKGKAAKVQFEAGVAAYKANDYPGASVAFGKSFALEPDVETLFAWAQAERKQSHCDKASELYVKLLAMKLPAANKAVVKGQLDECKRIIADEKATEDAAMKARAADDAKAVADATVAADAKAAEQAKAASNAKHQPDERAAESRSASLPPEPVTETTQPWFKDPLGDTLVGVGMIGVGIGTVMLISSHSAAQDSSSAPTIDAFKVLDDKAKSRGTIGLVAGAGGAALIVAGVIRYATRSTGSEHATVTGWLDGHAGGGLAVTGGF
jgi:hypothetical protein